MGRERLGTFRGLLVVVRMSSLHSIFPKIPMAKATYKDAGVDLDVYNEAMDRLPRLLARTYTPG